MRIRLFHIGSRTPFEGDDPKITSEDDAPMVIKWNERFFLRKGYFPAFIEEKLPLTLYYREIGQPVFYESNTFVEIQPKDDPRNWDEVEKKKPVVERRKRQLAPVEPTAQPTAEAQVLSTPQPETAKPISREASTTGEAPKRRGRPPGSKNKTKTTPMGAAIAPVGIVKRRGRPPGSKNKPK